MDCKSHYVRAVRLKLDEEPYPLAAQANSLIECFCEQTSGAFWYWLPDEVVSWKMQVCSHCLCSSQTPSLSHVIVWLILCRAGPKLRAHHHLCHLILCGVASVMLLQIIYVKCFPSLPLEFHAQKWELDPRKQTKASLAILSLSLTLMDQT